MRIYLILFIFVGSLSVSFSALAEEHFTVRGAGAMSCGKLIDYSSDPGLHDFSISWTQGFLSGVNSLHSAVGNKTVRIPDDRTIGLYLTQYCGRNPLSRVVQAAEVLYMELHSQQLRNL